ncbi:hypothetical protein B0J18DRAFT_419767 [Chaetomium sp. MPI-SDFR-AT-0129]|nr:hypothetical protein B0J18DRAFT_419767 [Chaetomium sp. MPI-SDFR-AT-0129]
MTKPVCFSPGCVRGWKKCTACTYVNGYMLKCCSQPSCGSASEGKPAGQRRCSACDGTGYSSPTPMRHACTQPHNQPRSQPSSRPGSSGGLRPGSSGSGGARSRSRGRH